jgi:hypothetical protein
MQSKIIINFYRHFKTYLYFYYIYIVGICSWEHFIDAAQDSTIDSINL